VYSDFIAVVAKSVMILYGALCLNVSKLEELPALSRIPRP